MEVCLGGFEFEVFSFFCEKELRFFVENRGEGSWVGGLRRVLKFWNRV